MTFILFTSLPSESEIATTVEFQISQDSLLKTPHTLNVEIPYLEVEWKKKLSPETLFLLEVESSWEESQWLFGMAAVYLEHSFKTPLPLTLQVGYFTYPISYVDAYSHTFSKEILSHSSLLTNQEDLGILTSVSFFKFFTFQAALFSGFQIRESDNLWRQPDFYPVILNIKYENKFAEGFVTYFTKKLPFSPSFQSLGTGGKLSLQFRKIQAALSGEIWKIKEDTNSKLNLYLFPEVQWRAFKLSYLFGFAQDQLPSLSKPSLTYQNIFQFNWQITENNLLVLENFSKKQKTFTEKGWAFRLITSL